jgi:hypothetical protein
LKLQCVELLSSFAFNFNLRRSTGVDKWDQMRHYQRFWRGERSPNRAIYIRGQRYTMIPVMSVYGVIDWKIIKTEKRAPSGAGPGKAVHVDTIKTRVESA